jgi:hypothetical protein
MQVTRNVEALAAPNLLPCDVSERGRSDGHSDASHDDASHFRLDRPTRATDGVRLLSGVVVQLEPQGDGGAALGAAPDLAVYYNPTLIFRPSRSVIVGRDTTGEAGR